VTFLFVPRITPSFSEIVLEVYLAGHINALTRQQNKVVRALARHGGDLSSYINQVDDRMDNLMEGIKENKALTKILAAKITNETDKLQERFPNILFDKSPTKGSNALFEKPLFPVVSGIMS
jgi:hypothetical protein